MDTLHLTCLTLHAESLLISIGRESAAIFQQGEQALALTQLIRHRALDVAINLDNALVRSHLNNIVVLKADIACKAAIEDKLIDIDNGYLATLTEHLDITECSQRADTTSPIEGMEDSGKGREGIGAWDADLTHDIDHDGTGLA